MSRRVAIIIAGRRYPLENAPAPVITFADDARFDFIRRGEALQRRDPARGRNWARRWDRSDGSPVDDLEGLREAVTSVILHADLVPDAKTCFETLLTGRHVPLSTHFMIDWDGTIIQGLDVAHVAFHAGGANVSSVGIDLNNELPNLLDAEEAARFAGYADKYAGRGDEYRRFVSQTMRINDFRVRSYGYTDAQYQALIELLKVLSGALDIPAQVPVDEAGVVQPQVLDDPAFQGILAHWHLSPARWDPGPGFDWERVLYGISGQYNSFPVVLPGGRNIAQLLTPEKVRAEADRLYRNNEEEGVGGTFPVARHGNWHGGIHLRVPAGTPVRAMFDGEVVLAHDNQGETPLGSDGFVVLRHDVPFPDGDGGEPRTLRFWSLSMHLAPLAWAGEDRPEWLRQLEEGGPGATRDEGRDGGGGGRRGEAADVEAKGDDDDDDDASAIGRREQPFHTLGFGLDALKRGRLAWFATDQGRAIKVTAGSVIGGAGTYGPVGERNGRVHVEIFTDDRWRHVVDMSVHRRYFNLVSEDVEGGLQVTSPEVVGVLTRGRTDPARARLGAPTPPPAEIDAFFGDDENLAARRHFRRSVTRHVSQWSDRVDWFVTLVADPASGAPPESWAETRRILSGLLRGRLAALHAKSAFAEVFRSVLPYVWLNEEVAERIGLQQKPWKGLLFHFHPIYFLEWLTFHGGGRGRVIARGPNRKELRRRLQAAAEAYLAMEQGRGDPEQAEFFTDEAIIRPEDLEDAADLGEELDDLRRLDVPGAWPLPDE